MRHRSKTNSRPWEDADFHYAYGWDNPYDEIARYFPEYGKPMVRVPRPGSATVIDGWHQPKDHIHHVWNNPRWDRRWNLVSVSVYTHAFCHSYPVDGRVLCVKAKMDKGEWDYSAALATLRMDPHGWLANHQCEWPWAEEIRRQLLDSLAERGAA